MLNIKETVALIEKAEQVNQTLHHEVLSQELMLLKREMKALEQAKGFKREIQEMTCEYHTNELNNTLILLNH